MGDKGEVAIGKDEKTLAWGAVQQHAMGLYAVRQADRAYFLKQMQNPVVATIVRIGETHQRPLRVLEVGSGSGVNSVCLALRGHDVTTVDISDHLLEGARQRAAIAARLFPDRPLRLQFAQGDVFDLRRYESKFDLVLSFGLTVIWRDEAKRLQALASMRATLKPGGWLLPGTTHTLNPLFKLVPVTPLAADLADHNVRVIEEEARRTGFAVLERGAAGLSEHFDQWLAHPFARLPLKVANAVFERLPTRWQIPVAPHVFVVGRLPGPGGDGRPVGEAGE